MPYWEVPIIWPGSTVYIIGGGPSLKGMDLTPIHNKRVIGVNNAFKLGDWVDVCWFGDCGWYDKYMKELSVFAGLKVHCCNRHGQRPGTKRVARGKASGIETRRNYISWNHSSGASAINLAVHFGAKKIILLGFDMKFGPQGENNWHNEHAKRPPKWNPYNRFLKYFPLIAREAKELGVEILNATPDSALKVFPIVKFEDVI